MMVYVLYIKRHKKNYVACVRQSMRDRTRVVQCVSGVVYLGWVIWCGGASGVMGHMELWGIRGGGACCVTCAC